MWAAPTDAPHAPAVSVIIPTKDRPAQLRQCLTALARSSIGEDHYEVIVVDDGGSEALDDIVAEFGGHVSIRLLRQSPSGPARARNAGAAGARAGLLAFTDDDCRPAADWLEQLLRHHAETADVAIGGRVANRVPDNHYSRASQVLLDYLYRKSNPDGADATFFASCNFAVPRASFIESGGFSESYPFAAAEDRDFCRRWKQQGRRLAYAADAVVDHFHTLAMRSFFRQHFRYGRGSRRFRHEAAEGAGARPAFERVGFYVGIVCEPFRQMPLWPALWVSVLLGVSQVATVVGFGWEVIQDAPARRIEEVVSRSSETGRDRSGAGARGYPHENRP